MITSFECHVFNSENLCYPSLQFLLSFCNSCVVCSCYVRDLLLSRVVVIDNFSCATLFNIGQ